MNDTLELYLTILVAVIADIVLIFLFINIEEFPMWAKIVTYTLFNIAVGMVIMPLIMKTYENEGPL